MKEGKRRFMVARLPSNVTVFGQPLFREVGYLFPTSMEALHRYMSEQKVCLELTYVNRKGGAVRIRFI